MTITLEQIVQLFNNNLKNKPTKKNMRQVEVVIFF